MEKVKKKVQQTRALAVEKEEEMRNETFVTLAALATREAEAKGVEEIEGIGEAAAASLASLLLETLLTVLIVDAALLLVLQDLVGYTHN